MAKAQALDAGRIDADAAPSAILDPSTIAARLERLELAMQFLHTIVATDGPPYEARRGLALYVQTLWAAVQYEAFRCEQKGAQQ